VLSGPGDAGQSPYLAGYMSVLACFYSAQGRQLLFKDPDFFISYFRLFMFGDFELIDCILRPGRPLWCFRAEVQDYLRQRLDRFFTMDHSHWADRLNQWFKMGIGMPYANPCLPHASNKVTVEEILKNAFVIDNGRDAVERGWLSLHQRVQALYERGRNNEELRQDYTLERPISHMFAQLVSTRTTLRLASKKVRIVNFDGGVGLAEIEAVCTPSGEGIDRSAFPVPIEERVPDGPAILECAVVDIVPFFVLRALEGSEPGRVLATFGPASKQIPSAPTWSHARTRLISFLSPDALVSGKDSRYAREIQEMADLRLDSKRTLRFVYEPAMIFHHLPDQPLTSEFLDDGFKGVLQDHSLVKALAALSIFSFIFVPEGLKIVMQRSGWEWLVSVDEIKVDYDSAVRTLEERGRTAGWKLVVRVDSELALVLPC
jgi:hypothetical protein